MPRAVVDVNGPSADCTIPTTETLENPPPQTRLVAGEWRIRCSSDPVQIPAAAPRDDAEPLAFLDRLFPMTPRCAHGRRKGGRMSAARSALRLVVALDGVAALLRPHGTTPRRCWRIQRQSLRLPSQKRQRRLRSRFSGNHPVVHQLRVPLSCNTPERFRQILNGRRLRYFLSPSIRMREI